MSWDELELMEEQVLDRKEYGDPQEQIAFTLKFLIPNQGKKF